MASELTGTIEQDVGPDPRLDPYGFQLPAEFGSYEEMMEEYVAVLSRRSTKWSRLLQGNAHVEKSSRVKRYVRKGVPSEHRARVWMAASGAQEKLDQKQGYYRSLLTLEHHSDLALEQDQRLASTIRTDLPRTFPDNVQFRDSSSSPSLQSTLNNVLLAYGRHNPAVGYCQGMNFIAGYLIIVTKDEEQAFWLMDALLDRILPDYYSPAMLGLKTDQEVLGELVRSRAPAVGQNLGQYPAVWTLLCSRWFICLFIDVLPVETVLRIWDCLFYEGSKILFRVALTLIQQHQAQIVAARSLPDVCQRFRDLTQDHRTHNCHAFMQKIFTEPGRLTMATIIKLRQTCRERIVTEETKPRPDP